VSDRVTLHGNAGLGSFFDLAGHQPTTYRLGGSAVCAVTRDTNLVAAIADWGESVNSLNRLQREFEFTLLPGLRQAFNFTDDAQLVIGPGVPLVFYQGVVRYGCLFPSVLRAQVLGTRAASGVMPHDICRHGMGLKAHGRTAGGTATGSLPLRGQKAAAAPVRRSCFCLLKPVRTSSLCQCGSGKRQHLKGRAMAEAFVRGASETGDPLLLTPGPLTTSLSVKRAMLHDWGSRDATFLALNAQVLERLVQIINGADTHVTVPVQGSGTFAVEAMLTSFVPRRGKVLLLVNGAYGQRARKICEIAGRDHLVHETAEDTPPDLAAIDRQLNADRSISHLFAVQCETTSGILNPIPEIAALAERHGRRLIIDAMSAFGAIPLDAKLTRFDAVAASSNKCIEGVPGLGFVLCREPALAETKGNATTLVLDLHDQWQALAKTGQYRFTPPIHVIVAFHQALQEFWAEGGQAGRGARYAENCRVLIAGMRAMGFRPLLRQDLQAPIIVTFHMPKHAKFVFPRFYDALKERGYVIYPGKLTVADSFRIGCIGRLNAEHMRGALGAIAEVLAELGVAELDTTL
jgi:2-aminoethylphosphonate-pyruvate transaminase